MGRSAARTRQRRYVVAVRRICERPGCGRPVVVVYGMGTASDSSAAVLWLEAWSPESGRAVPPAARGAVCQRHGDAMAPPQGWSLDDRREAAPRLFKPKLVKAENPKAGDDKKPRRPRGADLPRPRLFGENKEAAPTEAAAKSEAASPGPAARTERSRPIGDSPRQRTVVPPVVEKVESPVVQPVAPAHVEQNVDEPTDTIDELPPDSTKPWVPFFDPDDDLGGALDATGPLLREAFRPRGSNRRRDDSVG